MPSESDFQKLLPINNKVFVKPDVVSETTKGGIWLTESVRDREKVKVMTGQIVALGPRADIVYYKNGLAHQLTNEDLPVKAIFAEFGGHQVHKPVFDEDGKELREKDFYRVVLDDDVSSILE